MSGRRIRRRLGAFVKPAEVWALVAWAVVASSCLFAAMTRGKTAELVRIEESKIIDEWQAVGKTEEMDG